MNRELLKVAEVAEILRCSERTVKTMIYSGELEAFKVGNRHRIFKDSVESYINKNSNVQMEEETNESEHEQ